MQLKGERIGDPPTHECYGGWKKHELGVCDALGGVL